MISLTVSLRKSAWRVRRSVSPFRLVSGSPPILPALAYWKDRQSVSRMIRSHPAQSIEQVIDAFADFGSPLQRIQTP